MSAKPATLFLALAFSLCLGQSNFLTPRYASGQDNEPGAEAGSPLEQSLESGEDPLAKEQPSEKPEPRGEGKLFGLDLFSDADDLEPGDKEFRANLSFFHKYKLLGGFNSNRGIFSIETGRDELKEFRFVTTYEQIIRIPTSKQSFDFVRFSINFIRSYDTVSNRFFDDQVFFREMYINFRRGAHQLRAGPQIFRLGNVDFDRPIDQLHTTNLRALLTLDPEDSKQALPAFKYNWFGTDKILTLYWVPLEQKTLGRDFTDFRDEVNRRDAGEEPESDSSLRDYSGIQFEWTGTSVDFRLGAFHWFDADNNIKFRFDSNLDNATGVTGLEFAQTFSEKESGVNFVTMELDATIGEFVWKIDAGWFDSKNFISFSIPDPIGEPDIIEVRTIEAPYFAMSTSLERAFPIFFLMGIYSFRNIENVEPDSHILLYENEAAPLTELRDLEKEQLTVVMFWKLPAGNRLTLAASESAPFTQNTFVGMWSWDRPQFGSEWFVRMLRFKTERQKVTGKEFVSSQIFFGYSKKIAGL